MQQATRTGEIGPVAAHSHIMVIIYKWSNIAKTSIMLVGNPPVARIKNEPSAIVILRAERQRFAGSVTLGSLFLYCFVPGTD